mgnify:CR=1 FL=1
MRARILPTRPDILLVAYGAPKQDKWIARNLARGRFMSKRDWATYQELYQTMLEALQPPDLLVYLRCSPRAIRRAAAAGKARWIFSRGSAEIRQSASR